jgi:hypothetical protein
MERIMIKPRTTNIGMTPTGMRSGQILHSEGRPMRSVRESLLLKNGKKIYFAGLTLLFVLFLFLLPLFLVFQFQNQNISDILGILFIILLPFSIIVTFSGSAFSNLYAVFKRLPDDSILKNFDPLRLQVEVTDNKKIQTIQYHALAAPYSFYFYARHLILLNIDIPPEYYQIWTPIPGYRHEPRLDRYDFLSYIRPCGLARLSSGICSSTQKDILFDADLMEQIPYLHSKAKAISPLRRVGIASEKGTPIILALLTQEAEPSHIIKTMTLLEQIAQELEREMLS